MARPRKPTFALERSGAFDKNPQRREERANEPEAVGPLGDPPEKMRPAVVVYWREIEASCPWLGRSDRALVTLTAKLWLAEDRNRLDANERKLFLQCMRACGMQPGERSRMKVHGKETKPKLNKYA